MAYALKKKGAQVLYLGTNVPLQSLETVLLQKKAARLYTYLTQAPKPDLHQLSNFLAQQQPQTSFFAATHSIALVHRLPVGVTYISYEQTGEQ